MRIDLTYSEFKNYIETMNLRSQYVEKDDSYLIFAQDNKVIYVTVVLKTTPANSNQSDFEESDLYTNHTFDPKTNDGKTIVRAESRPLNCTTVFTCAGDSDTEIAEGKVIKWDFSNDDDEVELESGSSFKRKRIKIKFLDSIWLKEGTIYYHNALKESYLDFYLVCPNGSYYYDNDGDLQLASSDTKIARFICQHQMYETIAMGDELNTDVCSEEIPNNYEIWIEVTVPISDNSSYGFGNLEIYRQRTVIL